MVKKKKKGWGVCEYEKIHHWMKRKNPLHSQTHCI